MSDGAPSDPTWFDLLLAVQRGEHTLTSSQVSVLIAIVTRLDTKAPHLGAWPSIETIAHDTRLSRSTVLAALRSPTFREWCPSEPQYRPDGSRASSRYFPAIPASARRSAPPDPSSDGPVGPSGIHTPPCDYRTPPSDSHTPQGDSHTGPVRPLDGGGATVAPNLRQVSETVDPREEKEGDARTALPPSVPVPFKLELSEPAPIPEAKSEKSTKPKGSTIPKAPKSLTLAAWGDGVTRVTRAEWALSAAERRKATESMGTIVTTYAPKGADGRPICGPALTTWITDAAERYARRASPWQRDERGCHPADAIAWFRAGVPAAPAPKPNAFPVRVNASQPANPTDPTASHVVYEPVDHAAE